MNEPLFCWICVLGVVFWRAIMKTDCCQKYVGKYIGPYTFLLEWYSVAVFLLTCWLVRTLFDIIKYDYILDHFLMRPGLQDNVPPAKLIEGLDLPDWLRVSAVLAPLVGLGSFSWNSYHIWNFVKGQKDKVLNETRRKQNGDCPLEIGCTVVDDKQRIATVSIISSDETDLFPVKILLQDGSGSDWKSLEQLKMFVEDSNPWHLSPSADLTLMVIMMPAVFVAMAMRAEIRILQIFLGTSFSAGEDWDEYTLWRDCTYRMDLECAAAFQYFTVVAFALLCTQFFNIDELTELVEVREKHLIIENNKLRHRLQQSGQLVESKLGEHLHAANIQHQFSLEWAGLQGLWAYVIVGFFRCVFSITMAVFVELHKGYFQSLLVQLLDKYQPVFVFTAMLCIYNWSIIQRLDDIKRKDALGQAATLKFIAVRVLLLIGDGQKAALHGMVGKWINLSNPQASLLHTILLLFECFVVVAWNAYMWRNPVTKVKNSATLNAYIRMTAP